MRIITGDCLDIVPTLDADSIDAIVTDPPYGLEFMGKKWDRLGDVGQTSHSGPTERDGSSVFGRQRIAYSGSANRKCRSCGKWEWADVGRKCECAAPDFPNVAAHQARIMQDWHYRWAVEALRVAKPGAHLLAFGGTRTYHRLACAIEDAGWEVRDCLVWAYASGFPKSLDVSKAIDKAAGATREVVGRRVYAGPAGNDRGFGVAGGGEDDPDRRTLTAPATDLAREWQGWGTALKPAWEPIILARKPLRGTVAANVTEYGTGALNIDATRIPTEGEEFRAPQSDPAKRGGIVGNDLGISGASTDDFQRAQRESIERTATLGRWPANLVLTDPLFDGGVEGVVGGGRTGIERGSTRGAGGQNGRYGPLNATGEVVGYGDSGTYSRFFLIPKASRSDREPAPGMLGEAPPPGWSSGPQSPGTFQSRPTPPRQNVHPTVKPTALMRHLVRLVTPPGGVVLDPFLGSGTTAVACEEEGFDCIGIEREPEYVRIAEARLAQLPKGLGL